MIEEREWVSPRKRDLLPCLFFLLKNNDSLYDKFVVMATILGCMLVAIPVVTPSLFSISCIVATTCLSSLDRILSVAACC